MPARRAVSRRLDALHLRLPARQDAALADPDEQDRLEELIYRRYRSIDTTLARCRPIDPIIYEIEDNRGRPVRGADSVAAVIPFASASPK